MGRTLFLRPLIFHINEQKWNQLCFILYPVFTICSRFPFYPCPPPEYAAPLAQSVIWRHKNVSTPNHQWVQSSKNNDPRCCQTIFQSTSIIEAQPLSVKFHLRWRPPTSLSSVICHHLQTCRILWPTTLEYLMSPTFPLSSLITKKINVPNSPLSPHYTVKDVDHHLPTMILI